MKSWKTNLILSFGGYLLLEFSKHNVRKSNFGISSSSVMIHDLWIILPGVWDSRYFTEIFHFDAITVGKCLFY